MNASTRSRNSLVLSESSKTTTSPLKTAGEPILAHHHGRRNRPRFLGSVDLAVVIGRKAPRKSLLLAAKKSVGGDVEIIQDVTQVLFAAAVQIGLNSIGNPGSKVSCLGPAHVFFEDIGLHPAVDPVVIYVAGRAGGCAHLNRWIMGGLEPHFCFCLPYAFLFTRCIARLLSRTARAGKSEHQRQHQTC